MKIISRISRCVAFRVNINSKIQRSMQIVAMSLFVSMHFRFKGDINANFTMQNGERVFISAFFFITSFDTERLKPIYLLLHNAI